MSTEIQSILEVARGMTPEQRKELFEALTSIDLGERSIGATERKQLARSIMGKYQDVPTSSAEFMRRKADDTATESRS